MELDTVPSGARPRRVASDEEIDLADPSTWRINASGDVISTREALAQAEAARSQTPNGRLRRGSEKLRNVSASRRFKEAHEDDLLEGFHLLPTRLHETNTTRRELEEYHDIVRSMQEEEKDSLRSKIANQVAQGRYSKELELIEAEREAMIEARRRQTKKRKRRRLAPDDVARAALLDMLRETQTDFQWPTRDGQIDPSSSSHPWKIGEEVEGAVEKRWRAALGAQFDTKCDALLTEGRERREMSRNRRSRRRSRSRRDADSEDGESSPSVLSISSGSTSYSSDEDEEAAIKQAQETIGFTKEDLEKIDLPEQLSASVLGSISPSLQRALSILASTARNPHLKPPLDWKVMLNVLHSGQVCETSGSKDRTTAAFPLRRALERTRERLQAIYGEEYETSRLLRPAAAAAGPDDIGTRSSSAMEQREFPLPDTNASKHTTALDIEAAEDHERALSVSAFLRKREEREEQRRLRLPEWLNGVDEIAVEEIARKEKSARRAKKRMRRLEVEADRLKTAMEVRDAEVEEHYDSDEGRGERTGSEEEEGIAAVL